MTDPQTDISETKSRKNKGLFQKNFFACGMCAQLWALLCLLPCVLLFFLLYLRPLWWIIHSSLWQTEDYGVSAGWTLGHYRTIMDSPFLLQSFQYSLRLSLSSALLGILLALPACHALHTLRAGLRKKVLLLTSMASNFTGVPLAFAFIILWGLNGCLVLLCRALGIALEFNLYSGTGLLLIYTYFQIPLAILFLYPAYAQRSETEQEAALMLGASPCQYWWHIGLPLLAPAILGTYTILCAQALGAYATAYALTSGAFNLTTIRISSLVAGDVQLEPNLAAALAVLLLVLLLVIVAANRYLLRSVHAHR